MAVVKHEKGTRGTDSTGRAVYVARVVEVKDVQGTLYRYWVVNEENGRPGTGYLRLLDIGGFVADADPPKKTKPAIEYEMSMIPQCEAIPVERRR